MKLPRVCRFVDGPLATFKVAHPCRLAFLHEVRLHHALGIARGARMPLKSPRLETWTASNISTRKQRSAFGRLRRSPPCLGDGRLKITSSSLFQLHCREYGPEALEAATADSALGQERFPGARKDRSFWSALRLCGPECLGDDKAGTGLTSDAGDGLQCCQSRIGPADHIAPESDQCVTVMMLVIGSRHADVCPSGRRLHWSS